MVFLFVRFREGNNRRWKYRLPYITGWMLWRGSQRLWRESILGLPEFKKLSTDLGKHI